MLLVMALLAMALPSAAQPGGSISGVVVDESGQPVEGATVIIESLERARRMELKTNSKGEYLQLGLTGGEHRVSAEKDGIVAPPEEVTVRQGGPARANLVLGMVSAAMAAEAAAKTAALQAVFDEGVAATNAKQFDLAIEKFQAGIELNENCADCYNNIGFIHMQAEAYEEAEAAYRRGTEVAPNNAASYEGLAGVYNAMRRFDDAAAASAKATELSGGGGAGGNAQALFNQGVILWNAGNIAEAKKSFEAALAADPNHAESHFQLGMALVNEGNLPGAAAEFKTYLELDPDGENAATAKALMAQLNP
jgi:tetratricopeptide (TPR) repeat protein